TRPRPGFFLAPRPRGIGLGGLNATMEAYQYPVYYEISLAPRDAGGEIDFFEAVIRTFSKAPVRRVFELGAGNAPYLEHWAKRGYAYCGLDLSPAMIKFGRDKAHRLGIEASFVLGDMRDLDRALGPFDLTYVLLGSLYVRSNREFLDHLDRVADGLVAGGVFPFVSFFLFLSFHAF